MTVPAAAWTGTRPTSSPPTSPAPPRKNQLPGEHSAWPHRSGQAEARSRRPADTSVAEPSMTPTALANRLIAEQRMMPRFRPAHIWLIGGVADDRVWLHRGAA